MNRSKRDNPDVFPTRGQWRAAVLSRALWACQVEDLGHECTGRATVAHHVKLRSHGGLDTLDNGLACCDNGHRAIHDHPAAARAVGYYR